MSDIQVVMKFELLPNEILMQCFGYLNAMHIFHSFDQLNYRFNKLIRSIPLHLDFQNIHKLICDQFCKKLQSNKEIKNQIYSLHLSNKNTSHKIHQFLSNISLDEFPHLQSLIFTDVKDHNVSQITSILPFISQLSCFRLIDSTNGTHEILSALPTLQLQTLVVPELRADLKFSYKLSTVTNFTISRCYLYELCDILNNISSLKYLKVEYVLPYSASMSSKEGCCTNLKQLILMSFEGEFDDLVMILKQTPNLKSLTINSYNNRNLIDAYKWEQLITSSLPYFSTFKFKFTCCHSNRNNTIEEKFKEFRNDFWYQQHHWYTEYSLSKDSATIYTIPYMSDTYELTPYTDRYSNELTNNTNTFDNVKDLIIVPDALTDKCQYYFSHVTSMTFGATSQRAYSLLSIQHMEYLKMVVNLSNVKQLTISFDCKLESSLVLLEILKDAPQISSITIDSNTLISLLDDDELCKYLNRMIKQLYISNYSMGPLDTTYELNRFCKIFSNLEQLTSGIYEGDSLLFLSKHLPKLKCINMYTQVSKFRHKLFWLANQINKLYVNMFTDFDENYYTELIIWIIRDIY
jgi:hypothetical protein